MVGTIPDIIHVPANIPISTFLKLFPFIAKTEANDAGNNGN
jgi:hypothetical protein